MADILQVEQLSKEYKGFTLRDVNFCLPEGSVMGLIGENGAGKTTVIELILNLISRKSGKVTVFGLDNQIHEREIKEQLGVVMAEGGFYEALSPRDMAKVLRRVYHTWDDSVFHGFLDRFQLPAQKAVKELSRGMRMKLSIAAAMSHHPRLLILDEATSGLDPVVRDEILDIFREFIQDEKNSILISSHITSDLEKIADYITFIHQGTVLLSESKDDLIYRYGILKCGTEQFGQVAKEDYITYRKNEYGYEMLVDNKEECRRKYHDYVVDAAGLEDIMLFHVKGEKA